MTIETYLDIETTGLSTMTDTITVVGICLTSGGVHKVIQLVGEDIKTHKLLEVLPKTSVIYTYNGSQFDLPFIEKRLGIDITIHCKHHDLMFDCWKRNLYGGLKAVEKRLGIQRRLKLIDGETAVRLWHDYRRNQNEDSLAVLLKYNEEDVLNLKALKDKLLGTG